MDENNPLQPTTPNLAPEAPAEPLTETSATADPTTNQPADDSVNFNTEPVATEPEQEPSMSAQTEAPAFAPAETPKKKSNVLTLIFALIAVLGICFGIYGMFLQPEKEKVIYKPITPNDGGEATSIISDPNFIYIGEWGVKIKKPNTLTNIVYKKIDDSLSLTATLPEVPENTPLNNLPSYVKNNHMLGFVRFTSLKEAEEIYNDHFEPSITIHDTDYIISFSGAQGFSEDEKDTIETEMKVIELLRESFGNPENYSEF